MRISDWSSDVCSSDLEAVLGRDMCQIRPGDVAGLADQVVQSDSVEADIGLGVGPSGHQVGELATEAVADGAGLAGALRHAADMPVGGDEVLDAAVAVKLAEQVEGLLPLRQLGSAARRETV